MLEQACRLIEEHVGPILQRSSMYETEPWEMEGAEPFLNQVIEVTSALPSHNLLSVLLGIERRLGRCRMPDAGSSIQIPRPSSNVPRPTYYVSRPIDLDILFYGSEIVVSPALTIPHPLIAERRFVLVPLAEISREFVHPGVGKSIEQLLLECEDKGEVKVFGC